MKPFKKETRKAFSVRKAFVIALAVPALFAMTPAGTVSGAAQSAYADAYTGAYTDACANESGRMGGRL